MNKLKVGDKVTLSPDAKMQKGLDATGTYTVAKIDRCFVYLDSAGYENIAWYESDFEKIEDTKHIHHSLMIQYANDCTLQVEVKDYVGSWGVIRYPHWLSTNEYRIKPKSERKPFNLAEALAGKRVVTIEGDEVTQLVQFKSISYPANIYGVVKGVVTCWNGDGSYGKQAIYRRLYMQELN